MRLTPKLSSKRCAAAAVTQAVTIEIEVGIASDMPEALNWNETSDLSEVRAVVFDAVGTLIRPEPSVAAVYSEIGKRHGAHLDPAEVRARVPGAFARQFGSRARPADDSTTSSINRVHDATAGTSAKAGTSATIGMSATAGTEAAGQTAARTAATPPPEVTSDELERERWRRVVCDVFHEWPQAGGRLFDELWDHFASGASWRLFDEAAVVWRQLADRGWCLAIGSNFDRRLIRLCSELPPLDECRWVFPSSQMGYPKPETGFFRKVERALGLAPRELLLVGDDFRNDIEGAVLAGWHARWVHRDAAQTTRGWTTLLPLLDQLPS